MNKLYRLQIDMINRIMLFILGFSLIETVLLIYTSHSSDLYALFWLAPVVILTILICRLKHHLPVFWMIQAALIIVYLFTINNLVVKAICISFILMNALLQSETIRKNNSLQLHWYYALILIFMNLYCYYRYPGSFLLRGFNLSISLLYLVIFILSLYLNRLGAYFAEYEKNYVMPISQIKLSNQLIIIALGFVYSVVVLLFVFSPLSKLYSNLIAAIYGWITTKKSMISGYTKTDTWPDFFDFSYLSESKLNKEAPQDSNVGLIWKYVANAIFILILVAVATVVVVLITKALTRFYKQYFSKRAANMPDNYEFLSPFEANREDKSRNSKSRIQKLTTLFPKTNNEKIRKHYCRAVLEHADDKASLEYLTPSELSDYVIAPDDGLATGPLSSDKENRVTDLYEKARYSNEECSGDELNEIKLIIKEARKNNRKR